MQDETNAWEGLEENRIKQVKEMLSEMHRMKIDVSDSVFIVNPGGYIGDSTIEEIEYAKSKGKIVKYYYE